MLLHKLKHIKAFVFDIDGVLTNGTVLATESGELLRTFHIKDGYALQLAVKKGYAVCVISGGKGEAMFQRLHHLGIPDIYLGVHQKTTVLEKFLLEKNLTADQVLYMGDDLPDYEVMTQVGIAVCPADAAEEIKAIAHYIAPQKGGEAAVRGVIEFVLKAQQNWFEARPSAADASR